MIELRISQSCATCHHFENEEVDMPWCKKHKIFTKSHFVCDDQDKNPKFSVMQPPEISFEGVLSSCVLQ